MIEAGEPNKFKPKGNLLGIPELRREGQYVGQCLIIHLI